MWMLITSNFTGWESMKISKIKIYVYIRNISQESLMPSYYLYKIRKSCEAEQAKTLSFFDNLTPENFNDLKTAKKNYAECIRKVKNYIANNNAVAA